MLYYAKYIPKQCSTSFTKGMSCHVFCKSFAFILKKIIFMTLYLFARNLFILILYSFGAGKPRYK